MNPVLRIRNSDPEHVIGLPSGRFTRPNPYFAFIVGLVITVAFYLFIQMMNIAFLKNLFMNRGWVPYAIVCMTGWSFALIFIKQMKIRAQRKSLGLDLFSSDFENNIISEDTVDMFLDRINQLADHPRSFVLLNRIIISLTNFRNLRRVGDVETILRAQAELDEDTSESSYTLLRGLLWSIPILGFVGTVLGLSEAIGAFAPILADFSGGDAAMEELRGGLRDVVGGLATAFDTTLEALIAALLVNFFMTSAKQSEEQFLDDCREFCQIRIIGRLRLTPSRKMSE